jgi:hypothetical protein
MSIKITNPRCYARIATVEGPLWARDEANHMQSLTDSRSLSNYSFSGAILCWVQGDAATIYGLGGFHRYFIREDGRVVFSRYHCSDPKRLALAAEVGFDVE